MPAWLMPAWLAGTKRYQYRSNSSLMLTREQDTDASSATSTCSFDQGHVQQPARACVDLLDPYIAAYFVRLHALHSLLLTTLLSSIAHNLCPHLLTNGTHGICIRTFWGNSAALKRMSTCRRHVTPACCSVGATVSPELSKFFR